MAKEIFTFQAEVSKLLDIVAHSLYSHKEIFLRELISNASDACDRLRYLSLTEPELIKSDPGFRITIAADAKARTITVSDNGIGMGRDELTETLGTIARSGTQAFVEQMSQAKAKVKEKGENEAIDLIGQFGVGFYSSFMVADRVEVVTRRAGEEQAWLWTSDGRGEYTIEELAWPGRGTEVTLHLLKDEKEFVEPTRITNIVKTYSDHISIPIALTGKGDGEEKTLNTASALWTRDKKDISDDQYREFYHHVAHAFDDPWMRLHNRVEGVLAYTNLLFIPSTRPFDLFHPDRKTQVKLYVKRVFITDNCEELLPSYFRFMRGVVDSEDLPLNISREMFQHNPALAKIKKALTKRLIGELKKSAEKKPDDYAVFWDNFGAVLKEGLYEDVDNRDKLLEITRFKSTGSDGLTSLEEYANRMKPVQEAIYYITGEDAETLVGSPQLEGFKAKDVEVLLLTDPVDEFWVPCDGDHREKPLKSATRGDVDLSKIKGGKAKKKGGNDKDKKKDHKADNAIDPLIAAFKVALGTRVKDVRASKRLTDSPVCLIADEGDMDIHLERMLKQHKQLQEGDMTPRVLEINPDHALIKGLTRTLSKSDGIDATVEDAAFLLLDQAHIVEGESVSDPAAFSRRMSTLMEAGLRVRA